MANFTIMRSGLNTEIVGDLRIGQSSEDVTVGVTDDGTYQEYDKKLYYSYCYHNEVHRALCDVNSNSEHIIPVQAFLEPGIVKLSLELSNGTNKPTCNACFIKVTKGAKSVAASDILPDEETWQSYIQSYIKSNADTLKGEKGEKGDKGEKGEKGDAGAGVTVDAELSSTSTNPVQNKVIKSELDKKAYTEDLGVKKVIHTSNDTAVTINSGEYHVFPTMASLTITPGKVGTDKMFICGFEFTSGSTPTVLTLTGCTLSNSDDVTTGTYEVNILGTSATVRCRRLLSGSSDWSLLTSGNFDLSTRELGFHLATYDAKEFMFVAKVPKTTTATTIYIQSGTGNIFSRQNNYYAFNLIVHAWMVNGNMFGSVGAVDGWMSNISSSVLMMSPRTSDATYADYFQLYNGTILESGNVVTYELWGRK